jgi:hypothetical protein
VIEEFFRKGGKGRRCGGVICGELIFRVKLDERVRMMKD